jgi:FKBP-type peptidyl-prolyl cis-trans isomerase
MRAFLRYVVLGLGLGGFSPLASADYSNPVGIWDVFGNLAAVVTFPDQKTAAVSKVSTYHLIQFKGDGSYTTLPWLTVTGRWKTLRPKTKYQVSFAPADIGTRTTPPYLNDVLSQFSSLAQKKYGKAPKVTGVRVSSYSDRGKLAQKGLAITGAHRMKAVVTYTDPVSGRTVRARVSVGVGYRGSRASAPSECCSSDDPLRNQTEAQAFLTANAQLPGVKTTASGLQYRILRAGSGASPAATSAASLYYREVLPSGRLVASNFGGGAALAVTVSQVFSGLSEGLKLMSKGAFFRFYIPPALGFGTGTQGGSIKPNSALIFDVDLVDIK